MNTEQNKKAPEDHLLDDEAFSTLMQAEYTSKVASEQKKQDDLEQQKVWQQLSKKIKPKANLQYWLPAAAVAMLVIFIFPPLFQNPVDEIQRIKGDVQVVDVSLQAFILENNSPVAIENNTATPDNTLLFKVQLQAEAHVALIYSVNQKQPEIRFISQQLAPGLQQYIKRDDKTYGYIIEENDQSLRFCTIATTKLEAIESLAGNLSSVWHNLPENACVDLLVKANEN